MATLQEPDTGTATLGEIDVLKQKDEVRRRLGYLPQEFGVYPRISAQDMLSHIAMLKGITNSRERKDVVVPFHQDADHHGTAAARAFSDTALNPNGMGWY